MLKRFSIQTILLWLLVILLSAFITVWYISSERVFYYWDFTFYMKMAVDLAENFSREPLQTLAEVYRSTARDYNDYFALPLIPFLAAFQYSRLSYILGLVFAYHIPALIICGQIVRRILPSVPYAGWVTIFAGLFVPALWASVYRGFPDTGSVLILTLAVLAYLKDMELKRWKVQLPVIGVLSALAVVFRRHFAYTSVSFLFSVGVFSVLPLLQNMGKDWRGRLGYLGSILVKMQVVIVFFLMTVLLGAPSILLKVAGTNYLDLYSSYASEPLQVFTYFIAAFGILFLLSVFGYLAGLKQFRSFLGVEDGMVMGKPLAFVFFLGVVSYLVWAIFPRQIDVHYVLHIAPMIIVGLGILFVTVLSARRISSPAAAAGLMCVVLAYSLWAGLAPAKRVPVLTSINYPPLVRSDYDEMIRLVDYLRGLSGGTKNIYVVDSSASINNEIIHNAEVAKYGDGYLLGVINSPQVDSRDYYPLNPILKADYIVVSTPFQHHLDENEQKVVRFTFDAFREGWSIRKDFKKLPEQFHLADGVTVTVYERRIPTTPETALLTFSQIKKYVGRLPGAQSDWALITPLSGRKIVNQNSARQFSVELSDGLPFLSLLYMAEDAQGVLSGQVFSADANCAPVVVTAEFYSLSEVVSLVRSESIDTRGGKFERAVTIPENIFLVLRIGQTRPACDRILTWEFLR